MTDDTIIVDTDPQSTDPRQTPRESMEFDVLIVGAGPAGLSAAIRLKQLKSDLTVCVLEKGSEVGAHLLSGAVFEPRALNELIPDWKDKGAPLSIEATHDTFYFMTESSAIRMPNPPQMHNKGNYIISLGQLARWLGDQAQALGVEIYPGFSAAEILYDGETIVGIATGDMGISKEGEPTANFTRGMELRAKQTIFAEGAHGSCTKELIQKYNLRQNAQAQTYGLGVKEIWEIDPAKHKQGHVMHTVGWPMSSDTYGGSWIYHWGDNKISIGFVVGLDYQNPYLSPFEEMQRFKLHPKIKLLLDGGRRLSYGARALVEGGLQSLPKLTMPGAVLAGDCAGFLNTPKIKGNHTAMKSGMLAAEAIVQQLSSDTVRGEAVTYQKLFEDSWLYKELHGARNIRPSFKWGLWGGILYSALDTLLLRGKTPWTLKHHGTDHGSTKKAKDVKKITYPKPDGVITFDRLSSVFLSNTNHVENQPAHLTLKNESVPVDVNLPDYDNPETRYCPAGVYEIVRDTDGNNPRLQINAQNCVHCKTCDIKDPTQNIHWVTPEGGGGPNYTEM